jgi:hypothetical protein
MKDRTAHAGWWAYQLRLALERAELCRSEMRRQMGEGAESVIDRIEREPPATPGDGLPQRLAKAADA